MRATFAFRYSNPADAAKAADGRGLFVPGIDTFDIREDGTGLSAYVETGQLTEYQVKTIKDYLTRQPAMSLTMRIPLGYREIGGVGKMWDAYYDSSDEFRVTSLDTFNNGVDVVRHGILIVAVRDKGVLQKANTVWQGVQGAIGAASITLKAKDVLESLGVTFQ